MYTLKVCTAADNPPKEVIIHNNMTLRLIDIWEEPKWEMAFVISRTAVNPLLNRKEVEEFLKEKRQLKRS